jgi:hypothetical protein
VANANVRCSSPSQCSNSSTVAAVSERSMHCIIRAKSDDVALRAISFGISGSMRWRASISSAGLV